MTGWRGHLASSLLVITILFSVGCAAHTSPQLGEIDDVGESQPGRVNVSTFPPLRDVSSLDALEANTPEEKLRAHFLRSPSQRLGDLLWSQPFSDITVGEPTFFSPVVITTADRNKLKELRPVILKGIRGSVCAREALFVGHAESSKVMLNEGGSFLFTDFEVVVDRWIHRWQPSPDRLATAPRRMTLTWLGGRARVAGRTVTVQRKGQWQPQLDRYYLFKAENMNRDNPESQDRSPGYWGEIPLLYKGKIVDFELSEFFSLDDYVAMLSDMAATCSMAY
ncbi:MAG TPA: hypothetical protein VJP86_03150 [Vicinamibacterales bacterium]|jgi:hypothetical protein|nr:hypothetical protein [Vicinamibacterales bacterium]